MLLKTFRKQIRYLQCAEEALKRIEKSSYETLRSKSLEDGCVCHGAFNQHNIIIRESEVAVVNFDNWNYDVQIADLYQFMRKILEKHGWEKKLGKEMIQSWILRERKKKNESSCSAV